MENGKFDDVDSVKLGKKKKTQSNHWLEGEKKKLSFDSIHSQQKLGDKYAKSAALAESGYVIDISA